MKEKWVQQHIAVFVIALVLTIPVNVSTVMAASVSVQKASGVDGVFMSTSSLGVPMGYQRYSDAVHFDVQVNLDSGTISDPRQVMFQRSTGGQFAASSCSGSSCTLDQTITSTTLTYYTVKVYDESNQFVATTVFAMVPDYQPPSIKKFAFANQDSNSGEFTINYEVQDTAYSGSSSCIGLDVIEVYQDGVLYDTVQVSTNGPPVCTKSGSMQVTSQTDQGHESYCVVAKDVFDQASAEYCISGYTDTVPPEAGQIRIVDSSGAPLGYVSDRSTEAKIILTIHGDDVLQSSVSANLFELNGIDGFSRADTCRKYFDYTECSWDVYFQISTAISPGIPVKFSDEIGNEAIETMSLGTINVDVEGPTFTSFDSTGKRLADGSYLLTQHTNFSVRISERDLRGAKPYLDLSQFGGGYPEAKTCEEQGTGVYFCEWYNLNLPTLTGTETYTIKVMELKDALGNPSEDEPTMKVTVDTDAPSIVTTYLVVHHHNEDLYGDRTVKGDALELTVTMTDPGPLLTGKANFSRINGNDAGVSGACRPIGTALFNCTFESMPITEVVSGTYSIDYYIWDEVGNTKQGLLNEFVYGTIDEENPDYFTHKITCSPYLIDRQITELVNVRSYCNVELIPSSKVTGVVPIEVSLQGDCKPQAGSEQYIQSTSIMNNEDGSYVPILKHELAARKAEVDYIIYYCPITIISEVQIGSGKSVTTQYESENVTVQLGFYNLPLGEYSEEMKDKIRTVKDDAIVSMSWISSLQDFIDIANKICELLFIADNVVKAWTTVGMILQGVPFTEITMPGMNQYHKLATESVHGIYQYDRFPTLFKYCGYLSCSTSLWGEFFEDTRESEWMSWTDYKMYIGDSTGLVASNDEGILPSNVGNWVSFYKDPDTSDGKDGITSLEDKTGNTRKGVGLELDMFPSNPKDSLILSMATLCLPGIVSKLQEWRQIQCNYGVCLIDSMQTNMPQTVCEGQRSYLECKYITGEVFNILPFASYFKAMLQQFVTIFDNPVSLIMGVAGGACKYLVPTAGTTGLHATCHNVQLFSEIAAIANSIISFFTNLDSFFSFSENEDVCSEFDTKLAEVGLAEEDD